MSGCSNEPVTVGRRVLPLELPSRSPGSIPMPGDFGLDAFSNAMAAAVQDDAGANPHTDPERVRTALRAWILGFETDAPTIRQRQQVVRAVWDRPALRSVIDSLDVAPYDADQESRGGYQYALERFESYASALTKLRTALNDPLPAWLVDIRDALDEAEAAASSAVQKHNPRLALEVQMAGRVRISKRQSLLGWNHPAGSPRLHVCLGQRVDRRIHRATHIPEASVSAT